MVCACVVVVVVSVIMALLGEFECVTHTPVALSWTIGIGRGEPLTNESTGSGSVPVRCVVHTLSGRMVCRLMRLDGLGEGAAMS